MPKPAKILLSLGHARTPGNAIYHINLWRWCSLSRMTSYALAVLVLLVQVGTVRSLPLTESGFIQPRSKNATRVLVFVHGFKSEPSIAWTFKSKSSYPWTNDGEEVYWPRLVKDDTEIGDIDVYVYHFLQEWEPMEIIADMQARLLGPKGAMGGYDEIAFVAHSVGGNVVRQFILSNRKPLVDRVKFLVFLATPTLGIADVRALSLFVEPVKSLYAKPLKSFLLNGSAERPLRGIVDAWERDPELKQIPTYCGYEGDEYGGWYKFSIVEQGSACRLCHPCYEIQGNHSEIVKPQSERSAPHKLLRQAIEENWLGHNR